MKKLLSGFCVALSMYSKIPVPAPAWTEDSMKYALCFFPVIGFLAGGLELLWLSAAKALSLSPVLYGAAAVAISELLTGGIHLDGFTDTCDALGSFRDREKRLEIMKDPHVGAFGVLYLILLLLLRNGLYVQLFATPSCADILLFGFAFARIFGGLAIVWFPCARTSGLARTFADGSDRAAVRRVLLAEAVLCSAGCAVLHPAAGISLFLCGAVLLPLSRRFCLKLFGGITGDLAGFFISLFETLVLVLGVIFGMPGK